MKTSLGAFWGSLQPADIEGLTRSSSQPMKKVIADVRTVAPTRTTVLLAGETGTGKGLIARLVHHLSNRQDMPFAAVHCGAIPDALLESELFGHEKGAFTGAVKRRLGRFEVSKGGTLLLDEIGTVTPAAQIKLLQVLQDRVFQRVGGEEIIEADVRLIAATNEDLKQLVDKGAFRADLYYRVNVFTVEIPPLRERREDIPLLVELILARQNRVYPKRARGVHPEVMEAFLAYAWPGNIRELENLLERAHIIEPTDILTPPSFPGEIVRGEKSFAEVPVDPGRTLAEVRRDAVAGVERKYLTDLLGRTGGRVGASAAIAGVTPRMLHKLLTRHGIDKEQFRRGSPVVSEPPLPEA